MARKLLQSELGDLIETLIDCDSTVFRKKCISYVDNCIQILEQLSLHNNEDSLYSKMKILREIGKWGNLDGSNVFITIGKTNSTKTCKLFSDISNSKYTMIVQLAESKNAELFRKYWDKICERGFGVDFFG